MAAVTTLLVGQFAQPTGMARVMRAIAHGLAEHRAVHVLAIDAFPGVELPDHDPRLTVHRNPYPLDVFGEQALTQLCHQLEPDLIMLYHDPWHIPRLRRAIDLRTKVVAYCPLDGIIRNDGIRRAVYGLDGLAVPTRFAAEQFALNREQAGSIAVLPHGVDLKVFPAVGNRRDRHLIRQSLWSAHPDWWSGFWIANFNRNHSRKRLVKTLEGFARFAEAKPSDVRLYIHWGAERTGPNLEHIARALGISDRVVIPKLMAGVNTETLARIYQATDVGINTSVGEGWGLPAFEHAATGAPQIVPEHSACLELWRDAAILLPVRRAVNLAGWVEGGEVHPEDVAHALELLYANQERYEQVAAACLQVSSDPAYGWKAICAQWHQWLTSVQDGRR